MTIDASQRRIEKSIGLLYYCSMEEKFDLNQMRELAVSDGMMEAQIIKSKLDSFEIPCMLKYEAVGRVLGLTQDGLGKVQVMVPIDYFEQAEEILETNGDDEEDTEEDFEEEDFEETGTDKR